MAYRQKYLHARLSKIYLMLSIKHRDRNIHEVPLALVVGRVALFTITITITSTKVYTKNGSTNHTQFIYKHKYMHACKMLSDDF